MFRLPATADELGLLVAVGAILDMLERVERESKAESRSGQKVDWCEL